MYYDYCLFSLIKGTKLCYCIKAVLVIYSRRALKHAYNMC